MQELEPTPPFALEPVISWATVSRSRCAACLRSPSVPPAPKNCGDKLGSHLANSCDEVSHIAEAFVNQRPHIVCNTGCDRGCLRPQNALFETQACAVRSHRSSPAQSCTTARRVACHLCCASPRGTEPRSTARHPLPGLQTSRALALPPMGRRRALLRPAPESPCLPCARHRRSRGRFGPDPCGGSLEARQTVRWSRPRRGQK